MGIWFTKGSYSLNNYLSNIWCVWYDMHMYIICKCFIFNKALMESLTVFKHYYFPSFCRWGTERISSFPKVTQPASSRAGSWSWGVLLITLLHLPLQVIQYSRTNSHTTFYLLYTWEFSRNFYEYYPIWAIQLSYTRIVASVLQLGKLRHAKVKSYPEWWSDAKPQSSWPPSTVLSHHTALL